MGHPHLIDNRRFNLAETLKSIAPNFKKLSIATGYWDLPGTAEVIEQIKDYDSIRLIIGNEPLANSMLHSNRLDFNHPENMFPDDYFKRDLVKNDIDLKKEEERILLKNTIIKIAELINAGKLEVKVFRKKMLHAKAYIFGDYEDQAIGIVGSSNFTKAGLTSNTELNALQDDYRIVTYKPQSESQENGYLSWFDEIWNDKDAVEWNGDFKKIILDSPLGNLMFGRYDVYIKTLMEVYPDELVPPTELEGDMDDVLYSFQNRNAGILINKLAKTGVAILADSVGLGKTITAGAVIKHYLNKTNGKANILIIAPAALKQQWKDDLGAVLRIDHLDGAFQIVSEQDSHAIQKIYDEYSKEWRTKKNIDLFVIDEAHNLRSKTGTRHDVILNLLQQHQNSHILLLTATPINNSLLDIANQIQLALKGRLTSTNVTYVRPDGKRELVDFFDALKRIQSLIRQAEKRGESTEKILNDAKPTIHEGLRHYLVRSTRQGVEAEGGIISKDGSRKVFPKSIVDSIEYKYEDSITNHLYEEIGKYINNCFEGIDPRKINLNLMSEFTQMTSHPLDIIKLIDNDEGALFDNFNLDSNTILQNGNIFDSAIKSLVPNLLQIVFMLGYAPYRPDTYEKKYYNKSIDEINSLSNIPNALKIQMTVHNILHITWLKRLESSPFALKKSVENYKRRIDLFKKYLDKGYIVNLNDANLLESDYNDGEDIEQAFSDYEEYLKKKEELLNAGKSIDDLKKEGIEKKVADPNIYDLDAIDKDIKRDLKIVDLLMRLLTVASSPDNDIKMQELVKKIVSVLHGNKYGKKVLVFSFFADTINSLQNNLPMIMKKYFPNFDDEVGFITGNSQNVEKLVQRFSPISKKYDLHQDENELNFLFSTDVLSEGQNLQDSGFLINYDLHWNPVRMIQRNGRVNRLGSKYESVLVANMKPTEELEMYLKLVHRLETKINTIKNSIGLDQGILSNSDINPIEFIEKYYDDGTLPESEDFLAYTDEHVLELRKFLGKNKDNGRIEQVKNIPLGKWSYLPDGKLSKNCSISLIRTNQTFSSSNIKSSDIIFLKMTYKDDEYVADPLDYTKALDLIKTTEDDNERLIDTIDLDKMKIRRRSYTAAERQVNNPTKNYHFTNQYIEALNFLVNNCFSEEQNIDYMGDFERGIKTTDQQRQFESILRRVNKERKNNNPLNASILSDFAKFYAKIKEQIENESDSKKRIESIEGVLYYAGK